MKSFKDEIVEEASKEGRRSPSDEKKATLNKISENLVIDDSGEEITASKGHYKQLNVPSELKDPTYPSPSKNSEQMFTTSIYLNDPKTHSFGRNSPHAETGYTGFVPELEQSRYFDQLFEDKMNMTNYETALEFGKDPWAGYPIPKMPRVITIPPKADPVIVTTKGSASVPATKRELPLVDPIGSFASRRKLDDKGAPRIGNQKSKRFGYDSYLTHRPFEKDSS